MLSYTKNFYVNILRNKMKTTIRSSVLALRDFYQIVNTKEKAALFVLLWLLFTASALTYRFATVDAVERLMKVNCEINYNHSSLKIQEANTRLIVPAKNKTLIEATASQP